MKKNISILTIVIIILPIIIACSSVSVPLETKSVNQRIYEIEGTYRILANLVFDFMDEPFCAEETKTKIKIIDNTVYSLIYDMRKRGLGWEIFLEKMTEQIDGIRTILYELERAEEETKKGDSL